MTDHLSRLHLGHPLIARALAELQTTYGEALISVAVFGPVARGSARPDSDLDLLVVVAGLPHGRFARLQTFDPVERALAADLIELKRAGISTELSLVLRTPEDLSNHTPLLLDLTEDAVILRDQGGVLGAALADLRKRLARLGSRRIWNGSSWYWDLKPDFRRGEIVEI